MLCSSATAAYQPCKQLSRRQGMKGYGDPCGCYLKCIKEKSGPLGQSAILRHPGGSSPLASHSRLRLAVPSNILSGQVFRNAGATGLVTAVLAPHE